MIDSTLSLPSSNTNIDKIETKLHFFQRARLLPFKLGYD